MGGDAMLDNNNSLEQLIAVTLDEAVPTEISVTLVKGKDPRILNVPRDLMLLATLLSHCDEMPVRMTIGSLNWTRYVDFRNSECPHSLLEALPWKPMFGLDPADVVAVFYLEADFMLCGDGFGRLITLVLLQSGKMAAATASVDEMYCHTCYITEGVVPSCTDSANGVGWHSLLHWHIASCVRFSCTPHSRHRGDSQMYQNGEC